MLYVPCSERVWIFFDASTAPLFLVAFCLFWCISFICWAFKSGTDSVCSNFLTGLPIKRLEGRLCQQVCSHLLQNPHICNKFFTIVTRSSVRCTILYCKTANFMLSIYAFDDSSNVHRFLEQDY